MASSFEVATPSPDARGSRLSTHSRTSRASRLSRSSRRFEYAPETRMSIQSAALVTAGAADNVDQLEESAGGHLTIPQAIVVVFCSAFGAGISMVAWYPSLCGPLGFPLAVVIVGATAILAENALLSTARITEAKTFTELCKLLPSWMQELTEVACISAGLLIVSLYIEFCYDFVESQVDPLPKDAERTFLRRCRLYFLVGICVYIVTVPTNFSGGVAKLITNINLVTTLAVIVVAIVKGLREAGRRVEPVDFSEDLFKPTGVLTTITLLTGAMFQIAIMPQLHHELARSDQERAAVIIPCSIATLQAVVFLVIGLVGYAALGDEVGMNAFKVYSEREEMNDWMAMFLQGGIAVMMFLSIPLVMLPAKVQLWSMLEVRMNRSGGLDALGLPQRLALNAVLVVMTVLVPLVIGSKLFEVFMVVGMGTLGNWINMFLPAVIIWKTHVSGPNPHPGPRYKLIVGWLLLLAVGALLNSAVQLKMGIDKLMGWSSSEDAADAGGADDVNSSMILEGLRDVAYSLAASARIPDQLPE